MKRRFFQSKNNFFYVQVNGRIYLFVLEIWRLGITWERNHN